MSLLPLFLAVSAATLVGATDHIVGGHLGWNPNINYTLWSNNQTFFLNDLISFRYMKNMYNVFEVNQTGYDNCTLSGVAGNWSSGKDFILLNRTGKTGKHASEAAMVVPSMMMAVLLAIWMGFGGI
ncbi:Cupredoxins domain-containing protein [Dioscorea alata]|uniref:Cupredoxins domain-containing protein n=1 Tax=Dioscorea alata TaxID=55571 RepID=A0ACB7UHV7_DIOAL|nr:Cupredoxins domain-containing protein [Dioscorea alata]